MSILIKGMEMPKRCIDCPFMVSRENDDCILQSEKANKKVITWDDMKENCPLVEAQEPHWIPCSERLPKEEGFYLVTLEHEYGAETSIRFFKFENNKRYWSKWGNENITAWRQKPEPYKGVTT